MIQGKNRPELPGHISTRTAGMFSTFHPLGLMGRWVAWIVLLVALLITFSAWYFIRGEAAKRSQALFDFRVKTIETEIYEHLKAYEFMLRGGSALFAVSGEVTREDWRTYVTKLQINQYYPGIQGVGFSKQILPSEKEAHLRQIRSEGFPQYTIKPEGDRPEYTSIIFLEPFDLRNQRAFGYDMFSEPTRKEAMIRARDTGTASLSGRVTLVQETSNDIHAGFLIYLAIYRKGEPLENPEQRRKALLGYVYSPFRMNDFMKGIVTEKEGYVYLHIFDGEKPLKETLLYDSNTAEEPHNKPEDRHFASNQSILKYAGHSWLLSFVSSEYFEENIKTGSMNFILLLGITISLLLFGMVLSLTRSRRQAIALADTTLDLEKANIGFRKEIAERNLAEDALQNSEVKYRSMMESITDQLYICSPDFTVEYMNPAMISRLGRNAAGERCYNAVYCLDHRCDWCVFDKVAKGEYVENTMSSPLDGRTYRVTNMPIQHLDGTVSKMSIFRDITDFLTAVLDKDKAQAQLLQSQKMESIGNLAGGIAHDFNNILFPIIGFAEMSLEDLPEAHPIKENLEDILQGAKRARDLVKQLLAFSSQREVEQKQVLLAPLLQETLKLLRAVIPSNIDIRQELYAASDYILANSTEIYEVVMNLCTNAYHAMEKNGGTLSICLNKTEPVPDLNLPYGEYCCLSISDTGTGIPPEIINNIFDPYFTTKELGKGSGLGLSVVHGIVKNHHGTITVKSKPGEGTVFNVYFPIISAIKNSDENLKDQRNPGGDEKILFVDDEEPIVKLGVRLLEKLGYKVTGKKSSCEALALFKSSPEAFDLVITDMAMPEMMGTEFAAKLMETRPDIPVIICTGFSEGIDSEIAASLGIKDYISKPILSVDLSSKVRAVLDQSKKG